MGKKNYRTAWLIEHIKFFLRDFKFAFLQLSQVLYKDGTFFVQINDYLTFLRSTFVTILHHHSRQSDQLLQPSKQSGRLCNTNDWDKKIFICHWERFSNDNLEALDNPSKSGHTFSQQTVWKYLRGERFFRFKVWKKPYLSPKHNKDSLRWGKEHLCLTIENWSRVI